MARVGQRGVADVLAIAFMFLLLVMAGGVLHIHMSRPLTAATNRQLELKCEHLCKTLELAWVEPYSLSFLKAASEQLVLREPTVPDPHLRLAMENALDYLRPQDYGVLVRLSREYESWELRYPASAEPSGRTFTRRGAISVISTEGDVVLVRTEVMLFETE